MKKIISALIFSFVLLGAWGQNVPQNIIIKDMNGNALTFAEARKGEPAVVLFWSTTCRPCMTELTAMTKIEEEWKGKIKVIAISTDDARSANKIKSLVKSRNWNFEIYSDDTFSLYKAFNVNSIPASFVLDCEGKVQYAHTGYKPGDEKVLIENALKYVK